MLTLYRFCFVVLVALTVLLAVRERRNVANARAEGYAAAVDSVRAVEGYGWTTRTLDALGVPYTITVGDSARAVIHVGGHK